MKIAYCSDLHLEFGSDPQILSDADVLVLAGDIFVAAKESTHQPFIELLEEAVQCYKHVFYLMGNHEYYHGDAKTARNIVADLLPDGVKFLDNTFFDIDGVRFIGGTLWTDCKKRDPTVCWMMSRYMNDYHTVKNFSPGISANMHEDTVKFLQENISEEMPTVVCTHHAPHFNSVHGKFPYEKEMNHAYYTDLEWLMREKQPNLWIHGHTHTPFDYIVDRTRVVCNPHGYEGHEPRASEWEIQTVEI